MESRRYTHYGLSLRNYTLRSLGNKLFIGKTDDGFEIPKWDFIGKSLEYIPRNINQLATKGVKFDQEIMVYGSLALFHTQGRRLKCRYLNSYSEGIIFMNLAKSSILIEEMRKKLEASLHN